MSRLKKRSASKAFLKNLLLIVMSFGLLINSTNAFSQDAKTIKEEKASEKRKDVKKFFKKLNPFKKHDDDADNSSSDASKTVPAPPAPAPVPTPAPTPAPSPSPNKTTASTKKKVKKTTTTAKKTTTAQPFM